MSYFRDATDEGDKKGGADHPAYQRNGKPDNHLVRFFYTL